MSKPLVLDAALERAVRALEAVVVVPGAALHSNERWVFKEPKRAEIKAALLDVVRAVIQEEGRQ